MKGIKLILAVCLAVPCVFGARADTDGDVARAAARRGAPTTTTQTRQKPTTNSTATTQSTRDTANVANRAVVTGTGGATTTQSRSAINISTRENAAASSRVATGGAVVSRTGTSTVTPRANATSTGASRNAIHTGATVQSRATPTTRTTTNATRQSRAATGAITRAATGTISTPRRTTSIGAATRQSRAATTGTATVITGNYKECRTVYNECMDEFCANKDTQLRRCACSARMSEFDGLKEQMSKIEDKLLDFNQRLLTVNMDKEDALAINTATEGELAFNQADKSDSKKMLDEISKKLNTTFKNTKLDSDLSAINLSLDMDSAFDNLDSMLGADTVTKSGTELYSAALPICREMAAEVCSDDELSIAESGYQMMIEQDCNTVAKTYSAQAETAREKIREGGALLDMSRLNIHQTRNSDDILTCKSKMLEMLSDSTVCGANLGKCLDTSGQYIDPSTGEAFLGPNLAQLATLITRPTADQTWTSAPGNDKFVTFLNNKKKFLAPAMENCQDIADAVWNEFIEDALAQIKLAQDSKLEDMRQSCTQLVAQCMTDTAKSISDFDARALSTFGVMADKTVREMCSSVQTACTALLENTGGGTKEWTNGIDDIITDKTYETLLYTCREVGKNCIIQTCKATSGNFGLCSDIHNSVNRKSIINRRACWDEVLSCINAAGVETLRKMRPSYDGDNYNSLYKELYGEQLQVIQNKNESNVFSSERSTGEYTSIFDICATTCDNDNDTDACIECRLTERIWGNCENNPTEIISNQVSDGTIPHNRILMTGADHNGTDTLLSWFASNTSTVNDNEGCADTSCPVGMRMHDGACVLNINITNSNESCPVGQQFDVGIEDLTNCCDGSVKKDENNKNTYTGSVCNDSYEIAPLSLKKLSDNGYITDDRDITANESPVIAIPDNAYRVVARFSKTDNNKEIYYNLICVGATKDTSNSYTDYVPNCGGNNGTRTGEFFIVTDDGLVLLPTDIGATPTGDTNSKYKITQDIINYYKTKDGNCTYMEGKWAGDGCTPDPNSKEGQNTMSPPTRWKIQYKPRQTQ